MPPYWDPRHRWHRTTTSNVFSMLLGARTQQPYIRATVFSQRTQSSPVPLGMPVSSGSAHHLKPWT
jgi:hypothetical protein